MAFCFGLGSNLADEFTALIPISFDTENSCLLAWAASCILGTREQRTEKIAGLTSPA